MSTTLQPTLYADAEGYEGEENKIGNLSYNKYNSIFRSDANMKKAKIIRSKPWYRCFRENFVKATNQILAYEGWDFRPNKEVYETFEEETLARFIFESNNLEREGLPFGETRKLIISSIKDATDEENPKADLLSFPGIEIIREVLPRYISTNWEIFPDKYLNNHYIPSANIQKLEKAGLAIITKYGQRKREAMTVLQHYIAALKADTTTLEYLIKKSYVYLYEGLKREIKEGTYKQKKEAGLFLNKEFPSGKKPRIYSLLTERKLKFLHRELSKGLIKPDLTPAGHYRKHPTWTDFESHYPAPKAIPSAMDKFFREFRKIEKSSPNPIFFATWASSQLVLIHPFSDFNGRLSRIIMNMILRSHKVPFWISMRSISKERKRYFRSLKHYRSRNKKSMASLISVQVSRGFKELNRILEIADLKTIPYEDIPNPPEDLSDDGLLNIKWPTIPP